MSSDGNKNQGNPFESPQPGYQPPPNPEGNATVVPRSSVDYLECYSYVFQNPNWFVTILLLTLIQFIPVIGGIIVMGYEGEMTGKKATGQIDSYIDFDFNNFVAYLIRGLWIFLTSIIPALLLIPFYLVIGILIVAAENSGNDAVVGVGILIMIPIQLILLISAIIVVQPMMIFAALQCDFMAAIRMDRVKDFISKMWVEQLVGLLVMFLLGMAVTLVGMLFCFVGVYPAAIIAMFAYWYFLMQLYQVYVHRGGEMVPFKEAQV